MKLEGEMTQLGQPRKGREEDHRGCLEQLAANEVEIKEESEENFRENISACSQGDRLRTQIGLLRAQGVVLSTGCDHSTVHMMKQRPQTRQDSYEREWEVLNIIIAMKSLKETLHSIIPGTDKQMNGMQSPEIKLRNQMMGFHFRGRWLI